MHALNLYSIGAIVTVSLAVICKSYAVPTVGIDSKANEVVIDGYTYRKHIDEHPGCKGRVDLVVLIKWPSGMDKHKWYDKLKVYLPEFMKQFDIGEERFRVGLIMSSNYNKDFTVDLNGEDGYNKDKLVQEVSNPVDLRSFIFGVKMETMLESAYQMFKTSKRLNTTKMLYVITDGTHVSKEKVEVVFDKIRGAGIQLYVQGIGPTAQLWVKPHIGCVVANDYPCPYFMLNNLEDHLDPAFGYNRMCMGLPQNAVCKINYGEFNTCQLPCNQYSVKSAFAVSYTTVRGPTFGFIGIKHGADCKTQAYHKDLIFQRCGPKDCMTEREYEEYLNKLKNKHTIRQVPLQHKPHKAAEPQVVETKQEQHEQVEKTEEDAKTTEKEHAEEHVQENTEETKEDNLTEEEQVKEAEEEVEEAQHGDVEATEEEGNDEGNDEEEVEEEMEEDDESEYDDEESLADESDEDEEMDEDEEEVEEEAEEEADEEEAPVVTENVTEEVKETGKTGDHEDDDSLVNVNLMFGSNQNVKIAGGVVGGVVILGLAGLAFSKRRKQSVGYGYTGIVYENDDEDIKYDETQEEFTITGIDNALWGEK